MTIRMIQRMLTVLLSLTIDAFVMAQAAARQTFVGHTQR